ncbi:MAG: quinolinate synthase NadA [Bacteroides sp.]|nr:quinolinate synthase NadA [Roseburia sp.]MCM1346250.1 quinolinate synthase NadA [Bacteroides sp.]MCM1420823.1 quinolinate synthase NadA [Bacteroides sp.]
MQVKDSWKEKGYVDEPIDGNLDLSAEIRRLCKEKNAVVLAHYYTEGAVQDVADFVGDSLALAQWAAKTDADIIVMCGVHFMGETNKILCPEKKVLVCDLNAGCSLADSCHADDLKKFIDEHPGYKVVSYVNTTAAVKALTDVVVTSSNAKLIVDSFPKDEKLIFGPDKNLGNYINSVTGRQMLLWNGGCHVHGQFSLEGILQIKKEHPEAKILVHPECPAPIQAVADVIGSTAALLNFAIKDEAKEFIVATESGILHEMTKRCPEKNFIPAPPEASETIGCSCNECSFMRLNTLKKLYNTLKYEWPEIEVDAAISEKAIRPIEKMLEISKKLK